MGRLIYKNFPYPENLIMTIFGSKCNLANYNDALIQDIISLLDKREQEVVRYRYEKGMTYGQIAEELGISSTRVAQLIHRCCHYIKIRYACCVVDNRTDIECLGLSTRIVNVLKKNGVKSVYDLMEYNKTSLLELKGVGENVYKEIVHALAMQGLNVRRFR